ncbi:hypothetical protein EYW49_07240 [Siculibacillus lacustris]|uniref:YIP1 family protein n=1 Tax=Siculibacillus lacustris TaxID=1549641 RepID=A0A4Q9VT77_9HYPH|nr:hypothetical protein [Siculibacillus lacustris]TBW39276.1 hypothetical protein EYW49_07240 [Siculibacillus lacustris]
MIDWAEIRAGVLGSFGLLIGDPHAMARFDCSFRGFWRSFWVIPLMVPAALVSILADRSLVEGTASPSAVAIAGLASYLLGWIAFPVVMAALAGPLGLGPRYVPMMVARNWSSILGTLPYVVVTLAWLIGLMPVRLLALATLAALGFDLYVSFRVMRAAAAAPPGLAAGLVALDLVLTLLIDAGTARFVVG